MPFAVDVALGIMSSLTRTGERTVVPDEQERAHERQVARDLCERIGNGDAAAESELVALYRDGLVFVVERWPSKNADAEDLADEALMITIDRLRNGELSEPEKLGGFLRRTVQNLSIGEERTKRRRRDLLQRFAVPPSGSTPFDNASQQETRRAVRQLLDELPVQRDREILLRFYVQEEEKASICKDMGLDSLHFNRVIFRARARFKELVLELRPELRVVE